MPEPFLPPAPARSASEAGAPLEMAAEISVPANLHTLANGLRVLYHEDRRLPVTHVALWYHIGSKNEAPWRTGFAHLFEHLMFEGSRNNDTHFIRLMEKAGASLAAGGVNGTTSHDRTNYYETVPKEALGLALWAESDRMGWLLEVLDQARLDTQREVVRNERLQRMDNVPYGTAWERMFHALYPAGHPYSWDVIGDMGHLAESSLEEVHDFFRTWYVPNNAVLVIAGDVSERRALDLAKRYFGPIPPGDRPGRPRFPEFEIPETRRIVAPDEVPHARLYCCWPTVPFFHEDEPALDMLSDILSDGLNSRLYRRLVYEDRIASGVNAFHYSLESAGLVGVVVTARPGTPLARIRETLDEELARIAADGPTAEEVERVKADTQVSFVSSLERLATKADLLARYTTYLGDPGKLSEHWRRYREVEPADLTRVARRYLLAPRVELLYGEPEAEGEAPVVPAPPGPGEWSAPASVPVGPLPVLPPEPDRSRPPRRGRAGRFLAPLPEVRESAAGVPVVVHERRDLPMIEATLRFRGGKVNEPRRLAGLAHLTTLLMGRGAGNRNASEFEAALDRIGADLGAAAGAEAMSVSFSCLTEHLGRTLDLTADLLRRPLLPAEELARMIPLQLDGLKQARANPNSVAGRIAGRAVFSPDHPYGFRADEDSLGALRAEDLREFHRARFVPDDAAFIVCGDLDADRALEVFEQTFGEWAALPFAERPPVPELPAPPGSGVLLHRMATESPQAVVRWVKAGPPRDLPERLALRIALQILGGGFSSRLNLNLRERMGATYGAGAGARQFARGSMFSASASVNLDLADAAIPELLGEVERLTSGERRVLAREVEEARKTMVRTYTQGFETLGGVKGVIAGVLHRGDPLSRIRDFPERVAAVTREQVAEAAAKHLSPAGGALVVVGDADRLEPGLEKLGFGPITRVDADGAPITAD